MQLRRGALEYCVLARLKFQPTYARGLGDHLAESAGLIGNTQTLYPLLARLHKRGLVASSWVHSTDGPPRRYYHLTDDGQRTLAEFHEVWSTFSASVTSVLNEVPFSPTAPAREANRSASKLDRRKP